MRHIPEVHVDQLLVTQAQRGDRDAFASLLGEISDSLFAVAFRILRETVINSFESIPEQ